MKVIVLGADGYLGWPTCMYLSRRGYEVWAIDCGIKRQWEEKFGVKPLYPIAGLGSRVVMWNRREDACSIHLFESINIATEPNLLYGLLDKVKPDAIIHYAEQPSAPMSQFTRGTAVITQMNNVIGTLNLLFAMKHTDNLDCHLIKLGTMGEYGTPNIDIEEGYLEIHHNGRSDTLPFPKLPGSFYHASKVHDSTNIHLACRIWGIRATDLNQGIVYGIDTEETLSHPDLRTSFHYDATFGTVINRFVTQAVLGLPLTVYGNGSQTRGFLNIKDTLRCVELAMKTPAEEGEFRVFNQFTEEFSIMDLAMKVRHASPIPVFIENIPNPRVEKENHYYNARHDNLRHLGLVPNLITEDVLSNMIAQVEEHKLSVRLETLLPKIEWST